MKITAPEIVKELQVFWPRLIDIWLMDTEFWSPTQQEVTDALEYIRIMRKRFTSEFGFDTLKFISDGHDCDNYALELQADISRYRLVVANEKTIAFDDLLSWPFGTALCMKVKGEKINHALCVCRTRDCGIIMIEPRDFSTWIADQDKDFLYFVEMR